jgi:hypothetical protein
MLFAFDNAGPGDQEQIAGADADVVDLEGGRQLSALFIAPARSRITRPEYPPSWMGPAIPAEVPQKTRP